MTNRVEVYFNSSLTDGPMRLFRVEYAIAAPRALIGARNFFELAVAGHSCGKHFNARRRSEREMTVTDARASQPARDTQVAHAFIRQSAPIEE